VKDVALPGISIGARLKYLFAPPGWSHDGSRKSSRQIKSDYVRENPHLSGSPGLPDL